MFGCNKHIVVLYIFQNKEVLLNISFLKKKKIKLINVNSNNVVPMY